MNRARKAIAVLSWSGALGMGYFGIMALRAPAQLVGAPVAASALVFARYMAARNVPLAVLLAVAPLRRDARSWGTLLALTAAIQGADAAIGLAQHAVGPTVVPAMLGVLDAVAAWHLLSND